MWSLSLHIHLWIKFHMDGYPHHPHVEILTLMISTNVFITCVFTAVLYNASTVLSLVWFILLFPHGIRAGILCSLIEYCSSIKFWFFSLLLLQTLFSYQVFLILILILFFINALASTLFLLQFFLLCSHHCFLWNLMLHLYMCKIAQDEYW